MSSTRKEGVNNLVNIMTELSKALNYCLYSLEKSFLFCQQFSIMPSHLIQARVKESIESIKTSLKSDEYTQDARKRLTELRSKATYWKNLKKLGWNGSPLTPYTGLRNAPPYLFNPKAFTSENIISLIIQLFGPGIKRSIAHEEYIMLMQIALVWYCTRQKIDLNNQLMVIFPLKIKKEFLEFLPPTFFYTFFILGTNEADLRKALQENDGNLEFVMYSQLKAPIVDCQSFNIHFNGKTIEYLFHCLVNISEEENPPPSPIITKISHINPTLCVNALLKAEKILTSQKKIFPLRLAEECSSHHAATSIELKDGMSTTHPKKSQPLKPSSTTDLPNKIKPNHQADKLILLINELEKKQGKSEPLLDAIHHAEKHLIDLNEAEEPWKKRTLNRKTQGHIDVLSIFNRGGDMIKPTAPSTIVEKDAPTSDAKPTTTLPIITATLAKEGLYQKMSVMIQKTKNLANDAKHKYNEYTKTYEKASAFYSQKNLTGYSTKLTALDARSKAIQGLIITPTVIKPPPPPVEEKYAKEQIKKQEKEQESINKTIKEINALIDEVDTQFFEASELLNASIEKTKKDITHLRETLSAYADEYKKCTIIYNLYGFQKELDDLEEMNKSIDITTINGLIKEVDEFDPRHRDNPYHDIRHLQERSLDCLKNLRKQLVSMDKTRNISQESVKGFSLFSWDYLPPKNPAAENQATLNPK